MAMARRAFRRTRRRGSAYDMESIKFCQDFLGALSSNECDDPDLFGVFIIRPAEIGAIGLSNEVTELNPTKGIVFGGLTGDLFWTHNPITDDPLNVTFGFVTIWEAIHVQSLDEFGFPTYIPRLSAALGADRDVDLLWKRVTRMPLWGAGNDCGAGSCQLSASQGQNPDHIRIKSRRRITEKQCLMYSTSFVFDTSASNAIGGWTLELNGWLRLAVKNLRK